jgi:hypothetical protein
MLFQTYLDDVYPIEKGLRDFSIIEYEPEILEIREKILRVKSLQPFNVLSPSGLRSYLMNSEAWVDVFNKLVESKSKLYKELKRRDLFVSIVNTFWSVRRRRLDFPLPSPEGRLDVWIGRKDEIDIFKSAMEELNELTFRMLDAFVERRYEELLRLARQRIKIRGELLVYPTCCIEGYVKRELSADKLPPTLKLALDCYKDPVFLQTIQGGKEEIKRTAKKGMPPPFYSTYQMDFYPCKRSCKQAIERGLIYEERISEEFRPALRLVFLHTSQARVD